jgi:anti-sigma regulatory factor (Ser/Thr protein kinase)
MLATTEAFANAVEHGEPCERGRILVCVESDAAGIGIEVCDCGGCFAETGPVSQKPQGEGGRGIPIIVSLMDTLEVLLEQGVTRVRFEKRLAPA